MTPVLNDGEVIHSPGPATIAIFQDIGWNVAGSTTAPDAPTAVTATAGDASADVAWSPPASNGGSPIAAYTVTSAPDGHTCATTGALGCTVSGLTNGTEYQFKVTATNSVGTGPSSVPSNAVVPHASSSDSTAPTVNVPTVNFVAPQAMTSTVKVDVDWSATDDSGIAGYELQRRDGAGSWTAVPLTSPTATTARITVTRGSNTAFRVRATDGVGNVGPWSTTTAASTSTVSETASSIVYSGSWTRSALTGSAGGYVKWSSTTNDTATLHFSGTSVAFVSTLSPGRGIAEISVDGTVVATVDLRAATKKAKQVVWATDSPLSPGTHTVTVRVTGASTGTSDRVDVDAFIVWP